MCSSGGRGPRRPTPPLPMIAPWSGPRTPPPPLSPTRPTALLPDIEIADLPSPFAPLRLPLACQEGDSNAALASRRAAGRPRAPPRRPRERPFLRRREATRWRNPEQGCVLLWLTLSAMLGLPSHPSPNHFRDRRLRNASGAQTTSATLQRHLCISDDTSRLRPTGYRGNPTARPPLAPPKPLGDADDKHP